MKAQIKAVIKNRPTLLRPAPMLSRTATALRLTAGYTRLVLRWLMYSRECTNFTYHLTDHNRRQLAHFISLALATDLQKVKGYLDEVIYDSALSRHVAQRTATSRNRFGADKDARYGRRIGWYAIVRIAKPVVVVETGVDKGLGTCVLAAALLRNAQEGSPGKLYAIDINPSVGWLLAPPYDRVTELIISDSHAALRDLPGPIGVFLHDSNHTYDHEVGEYALVKDILAPGGIILSDNAHSGPALMDFAEANGLKYHFWRESPTDHFYPGAGIGAVVFSSDRC